VFKLRLTGLLVAMTSKISSALLNAYLCENDLSMTDDTRERRVMMMIIIIIIK